MTSNKKRILVTLICSIIIVIAYNLKIDWYLKRFFIPFLMIIISTFITLNKNSKKKEYLLMIPIVFILISNLIIKIDTTNIFLNYIILPILISILFISISNKDFKISISNIFLPFKLFLKNIFKNLKNLKIEFKNKNNQKAFNIFIGLVIGGIIGFIILILLKSADDYFNTFIKNISISIDFDINNLILLLISFAILFNISINIKNNTTYTNYNIKKKNIDNVIITTILTIINSVFILFLFSEFSRLTNNFLQIPLEYTYSSYAREGFFQLLFVTIINFSVITYLIYKTNSINNSKIIKNLILILITFSIFLIINSYYRMFLYVNSYGFTPLRIQVILFLLMETIIFVLLTLKTNIKLKHSEAKTIFIILCIFYILNLYICNDTIISIINNLLKI